MSDLLFVVCGFLVFAAGVAVASWAWLKSEMEFHRGQKEFWETSARSWKRFHDAAAAQLAAVLEERDVMVLRMDGLLRRVERAEAEAERLRSVDRRVGE